MAEIGFWMNSASVSCHTVLYYEAQRCLSRKLFHHVEIRTVLYHIFSAQYHHTRSLIPNGRNESIIASVHDSHPNVLKEVGHLLSQAQPHHRYSAPRDSQTIRTHLPKMPPPPWRRLEVAFDSAYLKSLLGPSPSPGP